MKILIVQDWLRSGGTERQSVLLANAFTAAGHPTTLLTFRPGGALAHTVAPAVTRLVLQPFDTRLDWFAPGLQGAVEKQAPDFVLCMGRMANCWAHAIRKALVAHQPGAQVVCTMRTGKPLPWWFRRSLRVADHVVANSRDARDTLTGKYDVPGERISVIHNSLVFPPVEPASARLDPGLAATPVADARDGAAGSRPLRAEARPASAVEFRARLGASETTNVLLCVAMFRPEKNQRELVEIAAGLPPEANWQLWLAGDGPARAACEALVAEKSLGGRVKFLGFQSDPAALYAAADIAVHASWSEALSNFLIEAQAHGLPVVAYDAQGISECFVPEETGWTIRRDDRDRFRTQLMALMQESILDRAKRAEMARTFARRTFDPERQVAAYLDLFTRLIRPRAA